MCIYRDSKRCAYMRVEEHICGVGAIGDDGDGVLIYSESRKRVSRIESLQIRKSETGNRKPAEGMVK